MKKKIIIAIIIFLILTFPIKTVYKDGGTVEYKAILYRVIKWNKIVELDEYITGTDLIYFPNNFHPLDYYDDPRPPKISIYREEKVSCNTGSYSWSKTVDKKTISASALAINPTSMTYKNTLKINNNIIYTTTNSTIKRVNLYLEKDTKWYELSKELITNLEYDNNEKSIKIPTLEKGKYILVIDVLDNTDTAWYSCSIEIE